METKCLSIVYLHNQRLMVGRANDIMIMRTCYHLSKLGHNVNIITGKPCKSGDVFSYYGLKATPNINITIVPMVRGNFFSWHAIYNLFCLLKLYTLKKNRNVDIVYLREIKLAKFLLRFKKIINLPVVIEVHDLKIKKFYDNHPVKNPEEEYVFKRVNGIIVLLNVFGNILKETYDIGDIPLVKIPLAADKTEFSYKYSNNKKIFYIGQVYPAQGVDLLIESINYLKDARLFIIGDGKDLIRLKKITHEIGLSNRVVFYGFVPPDKINEIAKDADVMVISARNKGKRRYSSHAKLYEYMAMGKPIVAFDLPSIREETEDLKNIVLAKPDDPKDLANKISMVFDNKNFAEALALNAYKKAEDFSWDKRSRRLSDFFYRVLSNEYSK